MSDWTELKRVSLAIAEGSPLQGLEAEEAMHAFECAATPDVVLDLIAENQRLSLELSEMTKFRDNAANHMRRIRAEATSFQKERDQLKAENKALRKDAERYRWLRNTVCWEDSLFDSPLSIAWASYGEDVGNSSGDDLDAAVDAAMIQGDQP